MSPTDPPRILVTRPLPQGERTAERLRGLGYTPILAPMLRIEPIIPAQLPNFSEAQALLVTSVNGAERLADLTPMRAMPVLTVGDRTAKAAKKACFTDIRSASGDGHALLDLARDTLSPSAGPIIHVRGRHAAVAFDALADDGFAFQELVAYDAVQETHIPPSALNPAPDAALLYSARTASALKDALQNSAFDSTQMTFIGISSAALDPLSTSGAHLSIAKNPDEDSILAALTAFLPPH